MRRRAPWHFDSDTGRRQLCGNFGTHDLTSFGVEELPLAVAAAGALLGMSKKPRSSAAAPDGHRGGTADDSITMNAATDAIWNSISRTRRARRTHPAGVVDSTVSPMGGRMLRRWLHRPLRDQRVRERHHAVQTLQESAPTHRCAKSSDASAISSAS